MPPVPAGLATPPARHVRLRALLAETGPDDSWVMAHTVVSSMLLAHTPVFLLAMGRGAVEGLLALAGLVAACVGQTPVLPRRARAVALAGALGGGVWLAQPYLGGGWAAALASVAAFLVVGLYRSMLAWAACAAAAVLPAITDPARAAATLAAAALSGLSLGALAVVREQTRSAQNALRVTRELLGVAGEVVVTADTMQDAACTMLDTLCDSARWVAGHLYVRNGDEFQDSGRWNTLAYGAHPGLVRDFAQHLAAVDTRASVLSTAMTQSSGPVWLSTGSATPGFLNLRASVTPERAGILARHGIATMLIAPVVVGGRVIALLELLSPQQIWREPEELQTLALVATLLARAGERDQARAALEQQHAMLTALELGVPDSVLVYETGTGAVVHTSPGSAGLWAPGEAVGRRVQDVLFDAGVRWGSAEPSVFLAGLSASSATRVLLPEAHGVSRTAEVYLSSSAIGARQLAFLFLRDVSERERAVAALQAASERTEALLAVTGSGVFELDEDGAVLHVNAEGARLVHREPGQLLGVPMTTLLPALAADVRPAAPGTATTAGARPVGAQVVRHAWLSVAGRDPIPVTATVSGGRSRGRTIVTVADATQLERAARLQERTSYALELNDTVTQGLTVALYALEEQDVPMATEALTATLSSAKQTVRTLLLDGGPLAPGSLRRRAPAQVLGPASETVPVGPTSQHLVAAPQPRVGQLNSATHVALTAQQRPQEGESS